MKPKNNLGNAFVKKNKNMKHKNKAKKQKLSTPKKNLIIEEARKLKRSNNRKKKALKSTVNPVERSPANCALLRHIFRAERKESSEEEEENDSKSSNNSGSDLSDEDAEQTICTQNDTLCETEDDSSVISEIDNEEISDVEEEEEETEEINDTIEELEEDIEEEVVYPKLCQGLKRKHIYTLNGELALLILSHPARIFIGGLCHVEALIGGISIHGYELHPQSNACPLLYGSEKVGYFPIDTLQPDPYEKSLFLVLQEIGAQQLYKNIKGEMSADSVLVMLKPSGRSSMPIEYAHTMLKNTIVKSSKNIQFRGLEEMNIQLFRNESPNKVIEMDPIKMSIIFDTINKINTMPNGRTPIVLVCGGSNLGKSTMIRFLINSLLKTFEFVNHLDLDPGQSEFTPSAIISLCKVMNPLLGPSFTHHMTPEKAIFLGKVNMFEIPNFYHASINALMSYYNTNVELSGAPLIINTMGWTRELGENLLIDIVRMTCPTHIVQMDYEGEETLNTKHCNLKHDLTPNFIQKAMGYKTDGSTLPASKHDLIKVPTELYKEQGKNPAAQMRELAITTYLGRLQKLTAYSALTDMDGFYVPFSKMAVCFATPVCDTQALVVLNPSLVALCRVDPEIIKSYEDSSLHLPFVKIQEMVANEWLGFGIIRGINIDTKEFVILTPEPLVNLARVNTLIHSSIPGIPEAVLPNPEEVEGDYLFKFVETGDVLLSDKAKKLGFRRHHTSK